MISGKEPNLKMKRNYYYYLPSSPVKDFFLQMEQSAENKNVLIKTQIFEDYKGQKKDDLSSGLIWTEKLSLSQIRLF